MKGELRKPASVNAILLIGIFTFVFLGAEYLFVNMISLSVTEGRTVIAQNYALGASAVGFFLYPAMERWGGRRYKSALTFILALGAIICTFIVQQHISYAATMTAEMVLFLLLEMCIRDRQTRGSLLGLGLVAFFTIVSTLAGITPLSMLLYQGMFLVVIMLLQRLRV